MPRTLQHIQDELLVIRCQDDERDALEELINRWQSRLRRHAWTLTADAEAVNDVCQESWFAIARGIKRLADPTHFNAWAYRIVTNKCADWTRAQQRNRAQTKRAVDAARHKEPEKNPAEHDEAVEILRRALASIDPQKRAILEMHYLDEMSVNQMAIVLDIPVGTVKSRLYHARDELKRALGKDKS